jgi:hypothetical protein
MIPLAGQDYHRLAAEAWPVMSDVLTGGKGEHPTITGLMS